MNTSLFNYMKLYLASTSPRRKELLETLNIPFEVIVPDFEETPSRLSPKDEVLYFAEQKVRSVSGQFPDSLIIGSDTLVECDGKKLGKPKDAEEARKFLKQLSGKSHHVLTAVVLLNTTDGILKKHFEEVTVTFRSLLDKEIEDYVLTGEPMDKAGAYAVQGKGGKFIQKIEGDQDAVVGLPLKNLKLWLRNYLV